MDPRPVVFVLALMLTGCSADEPAVQADARDSVATDTLAAVDTPAPLDAAAARDTTTRLTPDGWGPLRIGMSRAQITAVAGDDANPEAVGGPVPDACDQYRPERAPEGLLLMLERDTLTRITLMRASRIRTERGFGLGDGAAEVLAGYGDAAVRSPHKYRDAPSAYVTAWRTPPGGPSPARGIVYEIGDDGRVGQIHAGGESIRYVEGCL